MMSYGKELFMTFWGRVGVKKPQIPVNCLFTLSISIASIVKRGVRFPVTVLSIRDGFENGKHLLTEEGSRITMM